MKKLVSIFRKFMFIVLQVFSIGTLGSMIYKSKDPDEEKKIHNVYKDGVCISGDC